MKAVILEIEQMISDWRSQFPGSKILVSHQAMLDLASVHPDGLQILRDVVCKEIQVEKLISQGITPQEALTEIFKQID